MKLPEVKVEDVITYNDGSQRQISFTENTTIDIDKIIKIERPDYKTIFEKKDILDKEEKEYLSAIIKPFKDRDIYITKRENCFDKYFLRISVDDMGTDFPYFEKNTKNYI